MKRRLVIGLFIVLALVQIAVPLSMIVKRELVLKHGVLLRFKTAPLDPYDPFRGRYVALSLEANTAPKPPGVTLKRGQKVYAKLIVDKDGYAKISQITIQKPQEPAYLDVIVRRFLGNEVVLDLPIDRYYMEEKAVPQAEKLYREHSAHGNRAAYVVVRVKNGFAVVTRLYVGDQKIENLIAKNKKR